MIGRLPRRGSRVGGLLGAPLLVGLLAAGPARGEEGNVFSNLFRYGGTTVPPSQPKDLEPAYCPSIDVAEGGAALRTMAGAAVRTQVSLGRMARECLRREDGSVTVKVGVEARVLLGPAGAPGRFDVPLTVQIKANDKVVAARTERTTATIDPGEAQGFATLVVDDIPVPATAASDYEIEVSLGAKGTGAKAKPAARKPRRAKPAAAETPGGGDAAQ